MYGGEGNDALNALEADIDNRIGDDVYIEEGNDTLNALEVDIAEVIGDDFDSFYGLAPITPVGNIILGDNGPNKLTGTPGVDYIYGFAGNDTIDGLASNDYLHGGLGNDSIKGGSGNDVLLGRPGNDTLNGERGNDTLTGGIGSDRFLFNTALATAGVDRITDFSISNDKIVLDRSVFSALETPAGNVLRITDYAEINVGAAAQVVAAGNRVNEIVYNRQTGDLFYNPNSTAAGFGAGGGRFATLVGAPNISNTDFRVVA
jgi:Ca2+-binding RTX toxin-like protein